MKETTQGFLLGAGIIVAFISATIILKKFFNMPTHAALAWVILGICFLYLIILLGIEYVAYRARNRQISTKNR